MGNRVAVERLDYTMKLNMCFGFFASIKLMILFYFCNSYCSIGLINGISEISEISEIDANIFGREICHFRVGGQIKGN